MQMAPGDEGRTLSAEELKALGNEAYQAKDVARAVEIWNQALRRYVEEMDLATGPDAAKALGPDSRLLEQSLYLNLAQGNLKLGEPQRALRACMVVIHDSPTNVKALYRAAEACLALLQFDKATEFLSKLLEVDDAHVEGRKLLQRVDVSKRAEAKKQRNAAKKMLAGAGGFSEGRGTEGNANSSLQAQLLAKMDQLDAENISAGLDIAEAAARAARERENARNVEKLPEPSVTDLDAFHAKVTARTNKFNKYMDRSRRQRANAGHGLKLAWLRSGEDASRLGQFEASMREEARAIEEEDLARAAAEDKCATTAVESELHEDGGSLEEQGDDVPDVALEALGDDPGPGRMDEMD